MLVPGPHLYDRPRPDVDPIGIKAGAYTFLPSVTIGEVYDSNIFALDQNVKDDTITYGSPRIEMLSDQGPLHIDAVVEGAFSHYVQNAEQDTAEYSARVRGSYDLTSLDKVSLGVADELAVISRTDVDDPVVGGKPGFVHRDVVTGGYLGERGRYVMDLNARARNLAFTRAAQSNRDRRLYDGAARLGYRLDPILMPFVEPIFAITDYRTKISNIDPDAQRYGANVGAVFEIPDRLRLEGLVGASHWSFDASQFSETTTWNAGGTAAWNPVPQTTLKASLLRDQITTTTDNSSLRTINQAAVGAEYEFRLDLLGFAEAQYRFTSFREGTREDNDVVFTVGGDYLLNRNFALLARYSYSLRDSNAPNTDFDRNLVWLGARASF